MLLLGQHVRASGRSAHVERARATYSHSFQEVTIIASAMPWDITGPVYLEPDGKCDMSDIGLVAVHFGQTAPPAPAACDLTGPDYLEPDGKVDMRDVGLVAIHFGETSP